MAVKLLIRPRPFQDESIYSWLARISGSNMSRNKRRVLELADALGSNKRIKAIPLFNDQRLRDLAELTGVEEEWILRLLWGNVLGGDVGRNFHRQFLYSHRAKICPICLNNNGYWKKSWQILPITCCVEHKIRLTTSCKCGRPIPIYPDSIVRCECSRNYSKQAVKSALDSELNLAEYLLSPYFDEKNSELANRLYETQFALWYWYQGVRNHDDKLIKSWGFRRILSGVKYVGNLVDVDGVNILPLLSRLLEYETRERVGFRELLGNCHDYMMRMVEDGYQGNLVKDLINFEENIWEGGDVLSRSRYGKNSGIATYREAARQEGASISKAARCMSYASIEGAKSNSRRQRQYLNKKDVSVLGGEIKRWISIEEASGYLGVSRCHVLQFMDAKLIVCRKEPGERDWLILSSSCDDLFDRLMLGSCKCSYDIDMVPLKTLHAYPGFRLSKIIEACISGEVSYELSTESCSVRNLKFSKSELEKIRQRYEGEFYTAKQASQILKVNLNAIYYLAKKKYLRKSNRCYRNRIVIGFSMLDINEFRSGYCFYSEAKCFFMKNHCQENIAIAKQVNGRCGISGKIRLYRWEQLHQLMKLPRGFQNKKESRLLPLENAALYINRSATQLKELSRKGWITPYRPPSHHRQYGRTLFFTEKDLKRLQLLVDHYPLLMPLKAAAKHLGYDRSHVRKQYIESEYLKTFYIHELGREILCSKQEVYGLNRVLTGTVSGPELAKYLGVSRNTIYKWMRQGKLKPAVTPDQAGFGCYRYPVSAKYNLLTKP